MTTRQPDARGDHRWDLRAVRRSRWFWPLLAILLGAVLLAALSIAGDPQDGPIAFGVMVVVAIVLLARDRSGTGPAPRADDRD